MIKDKKRQKQIFAVGLFILLLTVGTFLLNKQKILVYAAEKSTNASTLIADWQEELAEIAEQNVNISKKMEKIKQEVEKISKKVAEIVGSKQQHGCPILTADATTVGLWRPAEKEVNLGKTIIDYSGKDNHGEIVKERTEKKDKIQAVEIANTKTLNPQQITIEVCYYRQRSQGGPLVQKAYTAHRTPYYQYFLREDGFAAVAVEGKYVYLDTPKGWPGAGEWIYAAMTFNGNFLRVYANGKLQGEKKAEGSLDSYETEVFFGRHRNYTGSAEFSGIINEVRISDTARTEAEISANWASSQTIAQETVPTVTSSSAPIFTPTPTPSTAPTPEPTDITGPSATPSASPQPTSTQTPTVETTPTPTPTPIKPATVEGVNTGSGRIRTGENSTFVEAAAITSSSKIIVTATRVIHQPLAVSEKEAGKGFEVAVAEPVEEDLPFDWWIIDTQKGVTEAEKEHEEINEATPSAGM